jgi:nicotinate-nucleotide adenylyltransferase
MNIKVGIFGGTFDPIHNGHIEIAKAAFSFLHLDELLFMPAFVSPHKSGKNVTSAHHRYNMVNLAISDFPHFRASDIEIVREGTSYTVDTLKVIHKQRHVLADNLFLIIGGDSLVDFCFWKDPESITGLCKIVVAHRPDYEVSHVPAKIRENVIQLPTHLMDVSSSLIREKISNGENIDSMVSPKIIPYIRKNSVYKQSSS